MYLLEWGGALTAIFGAYLIASCRPVAGYIVCGLSCLVLSVYCLISQQQGLLVMQVVFLVINLLGIYNWTQAKKKAH